MFWFRSIYKNRMFRISVMVLGAVMLITSAFLFSEATIYLADKRKISSPDGSTLERLLSFDQPLWFWFGTYRVFPFSTSVFFYGSTFLLVLPIFILPLVSAGLSVDLHASVMRQKALSIIITRTNYRYYWLRLLSTTLVSAVVFFTAFILQGLSYIVMLWNDHLIDYPPTTGGAILNVLKYALLQTLYYALISSLVLALSFFIHKFRIIMMILPSILIFVTVYIGGHYAHTDITGLLYIRTNLKSPDYNVLWIFLGILFFMSMILTAVRTWMSKREIVR